MWKLLTKCICGGSSPNEVYVPSASKKPAPKRMDSRIIHKSRKEQQMADAVISWDDTVAFVPPFKMGVVIKVYDGDTITIAAKLPIPDSPLYRISVRLNGIDCPEMKSKNANEHNCAVLAKQMVEDLVLNRVVYLENVKTEKYGRLLADVYTPEKVHINALLVQKRLAVEYHGDTKQVIDWKSHYEQQVIPPVPVLKPQTKPKKQKNKKTNI